MAGLFEAQVTNLGKYNEGVLAGEPLAFPTSPQEVQALLKDIGVDGIRYEEIFIACYDFGGILPELQGSLGEYESLDELNHLACLLSELSSDDLAKFEAALSMGTHTSNLTDVINLAENLDCFEFYPDIESEEDLGRYFTEDLEIPAELKDYFDYEAYGRDLSTNEGGHLVPGGYIVQTSSVKELYHGCEDIPKEHKVFSMPQLSIREQMAAYKEVIDRAPQAAERARPETDRGDR